MRLNEFMLKKQISASEEWKLVFLLNLNGFYCPNWKICSCFIHWFIWLISQKIIFALLCFVDLRLLRHLHWKTWQIYWVRKLFVCSLESILTYCFPFCLLHKLSFHGLKRTFIKPAETLCMHVKKIHSNPSIFIYDFKRFSRSPMTRISWIQMKAHSLDERNKRSFIRAVSFPQANAVHGLLSGLRFWKSSGL